MSWIVLVLSGMFEAVWATALGKIEGPQSVGAITAFVLGSAVSLGGLWWAMKDLPTGTAYAVWVAVGASTTVADAGRVWGCQVRQRCSASPRTKAPPLCRETVRFLLRPFTRSAGSVPARGVARPADEPLHVPRSGTGQQAVNVRSVRKIC